MTTYTDERVDQMIQRLEHGDEIESEAALLLHLLKRDRTRLQAEVWACIGVLEHVEFALLGGRRCPLCLGWTDENGESDHHHTDDCQLAKCIDSARAKKGDV